MKKYLIIGNGVAGTTAAENIRKNDEKGEITIVSREDLPFYYRVRLPDLLGERVSESELLAKKQEWYDKNRITLKLNTEITQASSEEKNVSSGDGEILFYDSLLLANGSRPFVPPVKGAEKKGVFTLHTVNDVRLISQFAESVNDVVLIGGGLLGLETAYALHNREKNIRVVEFFPRLLPRQLDNTGAARLQRYFEEMNFSFSLGVITDEIIGHDGVEQVVLKDGEAVPADMVIISAGVRPGLELARMFDIAADKGVIVNKYMQTSNPDIYAAGDVIEFKEHTYGIWPAALEQGRIAGTNMSGGNLVYKGTTMSNILKVAGIDVASAGNIDPENRYDSRVMTTASVYKKAVIDENRVIGCIMLGDRKNFSRINKAIATEENILSELDTLLSG